MYLLTVGSDAQDLGPAGRLVLSEIDPGGVDDDGVPGEFNSLVQQAQKQQVQIRAQQQMTSSVLEDVNELRDALIEKRFERLDKTAKKSGWDRGRRIPKEGHRHWEVYQEWNFLKDMRAGSASQKQYKPDWILE